MRFGSRELWLLGVCCVAQFMVILDLSIVNVALPSIQSALNFSSGELQWVIDAYTIAFAGFLLLGGRAADQLGQRRVFVAALVLFAATSLVGGASVDKQMLIAARAVQGFSCAFMAASSLAIITSSFPPGPKLHRAIGLWAAMNGAGGAAGTLFGGIITQELSWRWILLINPPIGIAAALVGWRLVADIRRRREGSFDLAGALTLTIGQMVLVYGVVEAGLRSWHAPLAIGPILGGLFLLMLFGLIESRLASEPLIPFKEFTRPLRTANAIVLLFSGALFVMWYLSSLYLQQVLGLSPLHAGLTFLPMALMIMLVASRAGKLVGRFGVRAVLCSGLVMMTAGLLLFTKIAASGSSIVYVMVPGAADGRGHRPVDRALHDPRHPRCQAGSSRTGLGTGQHLAPDRCRPGNRGSDHARNVDLEPTDRARPPRPPGADRRLPRRFLHQRGADRGGGARHAGLRSEDQGRRVFSAAADPLGAGHRRGRGDRRLRRAGFRRRRLARRPARRLHQKRRLQLRVPPRICTRPSSRPMSRRSTPRSWLPGTSSSATSTTRPTPR